MGGMGIDGVPFITRERVNMLCQLSFGPAFAFGWWEE